MIHTMHEFDEAKLYGRRDIEEEVSKIIGVDDFRFLIGELSGERVLRIPNDPKIMRFLDVEEDAADDPQAAEDAADMVIGNVTGVTPKRVILLEEDRMVLVLG
ncbi:hypothetical protein IMZ31_24170 (plasmid) [Pontibacillus sp. ALD_SL1]|uniref:hypothetical protein n=1 Tax=Pontibacillus sp. ALD_SL1 TaxID=2777185 RepID=UPI001A96ED3E|nr:hypothetical protein [Pontibacillus sp. ALD_SL1]QST02549.1 hypothetical protein IMZ31_24170 [Pontibacillus sp. ALD_SL1]